MDKQPMVANMWDPPSLVGRSPAGRLIRYVLMFHSGPRNVTIEVRGLTCTIPSKETMDKGMSRMFASRVFDLAKADFENADPDEIRAGKVRESLRLSR